MKFFSSGLDKILLYIIILLFLPFSSTAIDSTSDEMSNDPETWQMVRDFIILLAREDPAWLNTEIPGKVLRCYDLEGNRKSDVFELTNEGKMGFIEISVSSKKDVLQIQWGFSPITTLENVLNNFGENLNSLYSVHNKYSSKVISYAGQHYLMHPKISSYYPNIRSNIMRLEDLQEAYLNRGTTGSQNLITNSAPGFPDEFDYEWHPYDVQISPNLLWKKRQKDWQDGLSQNNVWTSEAEKETVHVKTREAFPNFLEKNEITDKQNDSEKDYAYSQALDRNLILLVDEEGRGAQINSLEPSFHYGLYQSSIKSGPKTPCEPQDPKGVCTGFFVYRTGPHEDYFEEIDIEILSREPEYVYFTIWRGRKLFSPHRKTHWKWSIKVKLKGRADEYYHTYGFKWLPDRIEFYVDDFNEPAAIYNESDDRTAHNIPEYPAYLMLNTWSGSTAWSGNHPNKKEMTYVNWIDYIPLENLRENPKEKISKYSFEMESQL